MAMLKEVRGWNCCVPLCKSKYYLNKTLSYHRFPTDDKLRKVWLDKINRDGFKVTKYSRVCSAHFQSCDFRPLLRPKKIFLKPGAYPTIFPSNINISIEPNETGSVSCSNIINQGHLTKDMNVKSVFKDTLNMDTSLGVDTNETPLHGKVDSDKVISIANDTLSVSASSNAKLMETTGVIHHSPTLQEGDSFCSKSTSIGDDTLSVSFSSIVTSMEPGVSDHSPIPLEEYLHIPVPKNISISDSCQECSGLRKENDKLKRELTELKKKLIQNDIELKDSKQKEEKWQNYSKELKSRILNVSILEESNENNVFYTGFPNYETFKAVLEYFQGKASVMQYWRGKATKENSELSTKRGCKRLLKIEDEFFLVLLRLRLGMSVKELARTFSLSEGSISMIFSTWICFLNKELELLFPFPSKEVVDINRPMQFYEYPNTRIIIDCTEFRVERPSSISAQRATFSSYKNYNTLKCLIGISPGGMVTFVSNLYGGAASDNFIVEDCGVLKLLEAGDDVMADKGFEITALLPKGVTLNIPPIFRASKSPQMPASDVSLTKSIAKVRVHVERAIRRIKTYHIFDSPIPLSMSDLAEKIVKVCSLLTNFSPALIKEKNDMSLIEDFL